MRRTRSFLLSEIGEVLSFINDKVRSYNFLLNYLGKFMTCNIMLRQ